MSESETLRLFLAVPADPAWVESAREVVSGLRCATPDASWTRPESWHITLHFLGETLWAQADRFAREIAPIVEAEPGGELETSGATVFPSRGPARVLAAGFSGSGATASLARIAAASARLSAEIQDLRPKSHDRFHPHVTLARLRRPWPRQAVERFCAGLSEWRAPAWPVRSCVLFQSRLGPGGAAHTPLFSWNLSGAPVEAVR